MKIVATSLIILRFVNLIRGQSEVDSEKVMGDSGWWSRRITKINRREGERFGGLASQDKQRHDGRWSEETIIRDSRRRPRPFASVLSSNAETSFQHRFESQREKFRNDKEAGRISTFDFNAPVEPSPILLPPFATPSPVYRIHFFDEDATKLKHDNESSLKTGKSSTSSAPEQIRIYEITTSNSTDSETKLNETNHVDDSRESFNVDDEKQTTWIHLPRETFINASNVKHDYELDDRKRERNDFRSFYLDHEARKTNIMNFDSSPNRTQFFKHSRGNRKYQNGYNDRKGFMRKRIFSQSFKHDWTRRSGQRSHLFMFDDDTNSEIGSVPGVPGRDYPIHQEHTHHHLRNVVDRFPCPGSPKSHVYLADRASRCQIFYVCYGSKTGIPMVCPNGTLFSEPLQVCDWWYNVAC